MSKFNPKVKLTWCGAEPTRVSATLGGDKIDIKPGEEFECDYRQAKNYMAQGNFLAGADEKEVEALVEKNKTEQKRLAALRNKRAKKGLKKPKKSKEAKVEKELEEDLEGIDEDDDEAQNEDDNQQSDEQPESNDDADDSVDEDEQQDEADKSDDKEEQGEGSQDEEGSDSEEVEKSIDEMTKDDCKQYLDAIGVEYAANAKLEELRALVQEEASKELHKEDEAQAEQK